MMLLAEKLNEYEYKDEAFKPPAIVTSILQGVRMKGYRDYGCGGSFDIDEPMRVTSEIENDPELYKLLKQGIKESREGKGIPWEQVKREMGQ